VCVQRGLCLAGDRFGQGALPLVERRDLPAASVKLAQASRSQHLVGQLGRGEPV
jgi:hypothetical protein